MSHLSRRRDRTDLFLLCLALAAGCTPVGILDEYSDDGSGTTDSASPSDGGDDGGDDGDSGVGDDTGGDGGGPDSGGGDDGGDSGDDTGVGEGGAFEGTVDCADLPEMGDVRTVDGARGYHDVIFTDDGYIIGSDGSSLVKANYSGERSVWLPGTGYVEQMDWLPDGDMVISSQNSGSLIRITADGGQTTLSTDVRAYEVLVGPDDMIYTANNSVVYRIDPDTGEKERLLGASQVPGGPRVLAFNLDYTKMYIGTQVGTRIFQVAVDDTLTPVGEVEVFADGIGSSYHDGMAVDVCGNLYVANYSNWALWRISSAGEVDLYWQPGSNGYGHGLQWGPGRHGWRDDALYVPRPYGGNQVSEVVIGVPPMGWEGEVLNLPEDDETDAEAR